MKRPAIQAALIMALVSCSQALAPGWANPSSVSSPGLMTRIRQFLGVQPRTVSVGGTRSSAGSVVCLLAPGPIQQVNGVNQVLLVQAQPDLVLGTPLNELEIRSGDLVLHSQLATSKTPIEGRLAWPLPPLQRGERLQLAMRPQGAAGGDWAVVQLAAASAATQQRYATSLQASASDARQRLRQLDQAAAAGDGALAQALLWAPLTPSSSALAALQREQQANCKTISSAR